MIRKHPAHQKFYFISRSFMTVVRIKREPGVNELTGICDSYIHEYEYDGCLNKRAFMTLVYLSNVNMGYRTEDLYDSHNIIHSSNGTCVEGPL